MAKPVPLISPNSLRQEPPIASVHWHVWLDRGRVLVVKRERFGTRQAARQAAQRAGELYARVLLCPMHDGACPFRRKGER